ncbi:MAG: hypothetical protein Q8N18_13365, partial [Opitutaceae bacterium]|nr:hypothetical protein [Opitutaceae bacterium]
KPSDNPDIADTPSAVVYSKALSRLSIMSELSACRDNGLNSDIGVKAVRTLCNEGRVQVNLVARRNFLSPADSIVQLAISIVIGVDSPSSTQETAKVFRRELIFKSSIFP